MKKILVTFFTLLFIPLASSACEITIGGLGSAEKAYFLDMNKKVSMLEFTGSGTKEKSVKGEIVLWEIKGKAQGEWILGAYVKGKKHIQGWVKKSEADMLPKLKVSCE